MHLLSWNRSLDNRTRYIKIVGTVCFSKRLFSLNEEKLFFFFIRLTVESKNLIFSETCFPLVFDSIEKKKKNQYLRRNRQITAGHYVYTYMCIWYVYTIHILYFKYNITHTHTINYN